MHYRYACNLPCCVLCQEVDNDIDNKDTAAGDGDDEDDDCADDEEVMDAGECSLLYGNNSWYLLLRLYYILCDRLVYFQSHAEKAISADAAEHKPDTVETAYALCLKTPR